MVEKESIWLKFDYVTLRDIVQKEKNVHPLMITIFEITLAFLQLKTSWQQRMNDTHKSFIQQL